MRPRTHLLRLALGWPPRTTSGICRATAKNGRTCRRYFPIPANAGTETGIRAFRDAAHGGRQKVAKVLMERLATNVTTRDFAFPARDARQIQTATYTPKNCT